jgi:hypothetical protein
VTGPVVELLNAVDWVVSDLEVAYKRVRILLPQLEPTGELHIAEHDFSTSFLRGSATMADRPTRVQLVTLAEGGADPGCAVAPFQPMQLLQGAHRRQRIHGTVLAVRNFDESAAWLRARGVPIFLEHTCAHLPYLRAWIGWAPDGRERVEGYDGGLFVELIPIEAFPRPVGAAVSEPRAPSAIPTLSVAGRIHLVTDLEAAVTQLGDGLGFGAPTRGDDAVLGVRTARWRFRHPGSADLIVAQVTGPGPAAAYVAAEGPGAWLTTVACADARQATAAALGAGARLVAQGGGDRFVLEDPESGMQLELSSEEDHG